MNDKKNKSVLIVMGSDSDFPTVSKSFDIFEKFGIDYCVRIISAHRTAERAAELAKSAREDGYGVIICAAGMAAHLAGAFAANTTLPVIGLPLSGGVLDGLDALLSTVQMPSGFPVATVAVNGSKNAAYLAISILSVNDENLVKKLKVERDDIACAVIKKDEELSQKLNGR